MAGAIGKSYEFRCPVHGFIKLNDWERAIVDSLAFQRLRRIRQLAWTEYIYPGATHTRFEHSLGVVETATRLYDAVLERSKNLLVSELAYNDDGLRRHRQLVRLAALMHDVGHAPFSHAAEELFPRGAGGTRHNHEDYSAAIIRQKLKNVIEDHPLNANYDFRADDVAAVIEGSAKARQALFWRELVSSQMDADRMDYLLRDSLHAGVQYGKFDLNRIVATVTAVQEPEAGTLRLGVLEGGAHAAEALVIARYFMFTQVYFHKTRVAFDQHLKGAMSELLPGGVFPAPEGPALDEYLKWDDWRVFGLLAAGEGGEHGRRLASRTHYREVFHTPEVPSLSDVDQLRRVKDALGDLVVAEVPAEKSWYKAGASDIPIVSQNGKAMPLSLYSTVVGNLKPNAQVLLYVRPEDAAEAREKTRTALGE